jgi:hypothetical protein
MSRCRPCLPKREPVSHGCPLHPRPELTGAEFLEAATSALGGGLELTEELLAELGHAPIAGPLLRCGCFLLRDCGVADMFSGCPDCAMCEPVKDIPF